MPACGFAAQMHPGQTHHDTSAQVALCSRRYYDAKAEQAAQDAEDDGARQADLAYERRLESAGDDKARLQDEMEARRGVIPFDEALRAVRGARLSAGEQVTIISTGRHGVVDEDHGSSYSVRVHGSRRPVGVMADDIKPRYSEVDEAPKRPRVDWAAIRRIPVGKHDRGRYALRGDDEVVKFYLVSRSDNGWTSVEVLAGPQRHEIPKPAQTPILVRIAADPLAAAELYADEKQECSQCGTGLTHPDSLARKMGPDCAKEFRRKAGAA